VRMTRLPVSDISNAILSPSTIMRALRVLLTQGPSALFAKIVTVLTVRIFGIFSESALA